MIKEKILVVDDEKDIVELLKYNLQKDGYEVLSLTERGNNLYSKKFQENKILLERNILQA